MKTSAMKIKQIVFAAGILALAATLPGTALAGLFQPGEILLNEYSSSSVQRYSATGTLLQTFTGTGTFWAGAALTPDGNLVTAYRVPSAGIDIFSPAGTQLASFAVAGIGTVNDVSVFPDGTLALCVGNDNTVQFWSQTGVLGTTVVLPGVNIPGGSTVGSDGILYLAGSGSNNLARVSAGGVSLGNVSLSFAPGDLVMNPVDGTLWVSAARTGLVEHITTTGTVLGSFATGLSGTFNGIGLAPDDNSLYVTSTGSTVVKHFDLSGGLLGSFALTSPKNPFYLTVVPNPVPEPATLAVGLLCLGVGMARRRRSV